MTLLPLLFALSAPALAGDAPEISRSRGVEGGVVVLWPRVIPRAEGGVSQAAAWVVQQELKRLAEETLPGRPVDVRPEPERVCPQAGCEAVALGAVLVHQGDACVVVATVSAPGRSAQTLVPWGGRVDLKATTVPFREPPESQVTIRDFQDCKALKPAMAEQQAVVQQALAAVAGVAWAPPEKAAPTRVIVEKVPE